MLLAVLEARGGVRLNATDVYLNIAGGLRVSEPAADLAVAAALVSAAFEQPTNAGMVYFGEIGLSGEVRQVAQAESRLKEAAKLGFWQATLPRRVARGNRPLAPPDGLELAEIGHISDLVAPLRGESRRIVRDLGLASRGFAADNPRGSPFRGGSMTWVDLVVLAVLALSALLAFMRGLVREVLGLGAWVGAIFAGVWAVPRARPHVAGAGWAPRPGSDPVAFAVVFIVALIVLMLVVPLDQRPGARLADRRP